MNNKDVIIALDFNDENKVFNLLDEFNKSIYVKVGMELFYHYGPNIVNRIKDMNHKVFLDLKLHDIPNTVKSAVKVINEMNIDILTVHCAGGIEMMKQAKEAANKNIKVVGVTQLTSSDQAMLENELLIKEDINKVIIEYAKNAKEAGLDGVICSPLEAQIIHEAVGSDFLCICPGIRYESGNDDQKRVTTPQQANQLTCDYIVVGRPISQADNQKEMYDKIKRDFKGEL
ncbi:MAG: orotidine-5'-phosphate decarboxylase [Erysipelotrichales bacterium]